MLLPVQCIESRTLALARGLSYQLQTTCQGLAATAQDLPQHIQDQVLTITHSAAQVYTSFSQAVAFGDLSDGMLASSRAQLHRLREALDHTMDYLVNNTPLNWLVGPFYQYMEPGKPQSSGGDDAGLGLSVGPSHPHDAKCSVSPPANSTHLQPDVDRKPDYAQICSQGIIACDMKARKLVDYKK